MKAYLDHGATTPVDAQVMKAMMPYFSRKFGNANSIHSWGEEAKQAVDKAREIIAKSINAEPDEIIFTSGGTEADNLAVKGIVKKYAHGHIVTSTIEHPAVLNTCKELEEEGYAVTYVNVDKDGIIKMDELENAIREDTVLVTVMHANNEIGSVQPIEKIAHICREKNIVFHTDAVQSYTKIPIDVQIKGMDLMSLSAHKIYGPKGIGALYVKKGTLLKRQMDGGHQEGNRRGGTTNVPAVVGFGKAASLNHKTKQIEQMKDYFIEKLLEIEGTSINGSLKHRVPNNISVSFEAVEGESMVMHLSMKGIACSTGSACTSHSLTPSHVLMALGMSPEEAHGTLRFALGKETTKAHIDFAVKAIKEAYDKLRIMSPVKRKRKKRAPKWNIQKTARRW